MENLHVKFEHDEALIGKKDILYSQINLLELLKILKDYKNSRKRELILKLRFKKELAVVRTKIAEIEESFPKETQGEIKMIRKIKPKERESQNIESQLQEIREKLEVLGQ